MQTKLETFGSKIGMLAAVVGSSVGLGNVWRFPNEVHENGGAAFLIIYIFCLLVFGIPTMLAEFSLGRAGKSDAIGAYKNTRKGGYWWIGGMFAILACYLIAFFYMLVAGWTLEYLWATLNGSLFENLQPGNEPAFFTGKMNSMVLNSYEPIFWTGIVLVINLVILLKGVNKGIERISNMLMPMLFVILLIFCAASLSMPNASKGVAYFLQPDFTKVSFDTVIDAMGQAFFSLSIGMGILVTYSAYFPAKANLQSTAVSVSLLDFLVSFLMGLIIFPTIASFGVEGSIGGTGLIFVTMPQVFTSMPWPRLWSALFFILLAVAAITSTISVAEVAVAFLRDRAKMGRTKACYAVILPLFVFCPLCSLSLGIMPELQIAGDSLFDFLDEFTSNVLLIIAAFILCVYVGWVMPKDFFKKQMTNEGTGKAYLVEFIHMLIKYLCPILIVLIFAFKFFSM